MAEQKHESPKATLGTPGVAHTGAKVPEKRTELGKGLREHVEGIMKKHEAADPTLPSPTEVAVRALGLRCQQLLAEAEALAAQIELYEVPKEDDERRAEAKKNEAALKAHQDKSAKEKEKV